MRHWKMIPPSIRWRLPLTYAGIALLAALALGAVLLMTLRSYYEQLEYQYLVNNAETISRMIEMDENALTAEALQVRLRSISFLAQIRVRLMDAQNQIIADSGSPADNHLVNVSFQRLARPAAGPPGDLIILGSTEGIAVGSDEAVPAITLYQSGTTIQPAEDSSLWVDTSTLPAINRFNFFVAERSPGPRLPDDHFVFRSPHERPTSPVSAEAGYFSRSGQFVGLVQVSEGPAYGVEIVTGVAQAWLLASAVAVLVAGAVGMFISHRISAPLIALTSVTQRMSSGDLSARAAMQGRDEVGILARSFNEMAGRVEDTVSALRRFVADAAHELHTPLTALRTNLELINEEIDINQRNLFIERAQAQVVRLEALTTSLLELSRLEGGMAANGHEPIDLTALIRETSELYASQAEQVGIDFALTLPDNAVIIQAQDGQIRHALNNLIENAIKFTPEGGTITIGVSQQETQVELWVQDTGIGIPDDDLPHLFSRFHRGRNAFHIPGSGLGLAIVKAIADYHKGQVSAEKLEQGTRLCLRLPAHT